MIYANVVKFHGSLMVSLYAEDKTAFALCTKSPPVSQALLTRMQTSLKLCFLAYCVLIFCVLGVGGGKIGATDLPDAGDWVTLIISMISIAILWGGDETIGPLSRLKIRSLLMALRLTNPLL